jgi:predicted transcriptional regulator
MGVIAVSLEISEETKVRVLANARARGLEADDYLRRLMLEAEEQSDFVSAIEEGLADVEGGRVRPMREALSQLGAKLGFPS